MTRFITAIIATLALAVPLASAAQNMTDMKGMKMAPAGKSAAVKTGKATGVIKALDQKAGKVTLQHGPIPTVGWPAMTMTFKAVPAAILEGLKVGQKVEFEVRTPAMGPEVTAIRVQPGR